MSTSASPDIGPFAGTWDLQKIPPKSGTESSILETSPPAPESVVGVDDRKLVSAADFGPGGKYRSIVKLEIRYEKQNDSDPSAMGTGWLIANHLVVTAGHCVYDWGHSLGRCTSVNAFIGYNGINSVKTPDVQHRRALKVVATGGWLQAAENRQNDVAFIQLETPFVNVKPIKFKSTPLTGNEEIGVVGYPGDRYIGEERGAAMYEHFKPLKWNLAETDAHMLEYDLDTFGGQSGSPVLIRQSTAGSNELVSIGAHVYGIHGGKMTNSASVINGLYGNQYAQYIAVMQNNTQPTRIDKGIKYVSLPKSESSLIAASGEEGFIGDVLSGLGRAASTIGPIIQAGSTFLGPIGGPIAALAGTALSAAGQLATESDIGELQGGDNLTQRGILAEAALQTVLKMSESKPEAVEKSGICDKMLGNYEKMIPDAKAVAPKVLMSVVGPALSLTLNKNAAESDIQATSDPTLAQLVNFDANKPEGEAFLETLTSVTSTAFRVTKKYGLSILKDILNGPAESAFDQQGTLINDHFENLSKRAVMGEAALQALADGNSLSGEEGFLDMFRSVVATIGTQVIPIASTVIKDVAPIVGSLLAKI